MHSFKVDILYQLNCVNDTLVKGILCGIVDVNARACECLWCMCVFVLRLGRMLIRVQIIAPHIQLILKYLDRLTTSAIGLCTYVMVK